MNRIAAVIFFAVAVLPAISSADELHDDWKFLFSGTVGSDGYFGYGNFGVVRYPGIECNAMHDDTQAVADDAASLAAISGFLMKQVR